jgi:hypothetical protein
MLAHACGIAGQEHAQCTLTYDGRVAMKQLRCRQALLIGLFATLWLLEGGLLATTHAARSTHGRHGGPSHCVHPGRIYMISVPQT